MIITPNTPDLISTILGQQWQRRWLADGDSWFSIGGLTGNLLMALDDTDTLIVNCAYPGDELADSRAIGNDEFATLLDSTDGMPAWDAVLLSAGGNDVIKSGADFVCHSPGTHHINQPALDEVLDQFERHLIRFVRLTQAAQPGVPVYCHTYDYPPVHRRWWPWHLGPWITPVLKAHSIPRSEWLLPVGTMINSLAERMYNVAHQHPQLHVIDTRDTLVDADWRNEIHPSLRGYHATARHWRAALNRTAEQEHQP